MDFSLFIAALGLLFVFEGFLPFLSPRFWRRTIQHMLSQSDRVIRIVGLVSMLIGLALLYYARG